MIEICHRRFIVPRPGSPLGNFDLADYLYHKHQTSL